MSDKVIVIEDGKIIDIFEKKEIINKIDFLKEHGIKIPFGVELIYKLKENGINIKIENWDKEEIIKKIVEVAR